MSDSLRRVRQRFSARVVAAVRARVVFQVDAAVGTEPLLRSATLDGVAEHIDRTEARLRSAELQLAASAALLAPLEGPFTPAFTMAQVLRRHPKASQVLAEIGLPGCGGCAVRHDETLAEAIDGYGFNGPALLERLNGLLDSSPSVPGTVAAKG